jgi:hypothetical protein
MRRDADESERERIERNKLYELRIAAKQKINSFVEPYGLSGSFFEYDYESIWNVEAGLHFSLSGLHFDVYSRNLSDERPVPIFRIKRVPFEIQGSAILPDREYFGFDQFLPIIEKMVVAVGKPTDIVKAEKDAWRKEEERKAAEKRRLERNSADFSWGWLAAFVLFISIAAYFEYRF